MKEIVSGCFSEHSVFHCIMLCYHVHVMAVLVTNLVLLLLINLI